MKNGVYPNDFTGVCQKWQALFFHILEAEKQQALLEEFYGEK
ncbi:MAG: hypothetical protein U0O00_01305 [Frisingicoccus sp.]|nr:hypothetical protein [Frisingicoccus sp.]